MALQDTDLFVVQSQDDGKLYKLRLDRLLQEFEGSSGIQFRGSVDLNNGAAGQGITLPAQNGDLYIVESDALTINTDWIMEGGAGVGTASENDRIIWDDNGDQPGYWVLVEGGSSTGGTLTGITVTDPLQSDGDTVNPTITIDEATTTEVGAVVKRLATADDVKHDSVTADLDGYAVTADLLKHTNEVVEALSIAAGGVTTVSTTNSNGALTISPNSGNVVVEVNNASDATFGVVQVASDSDITNGTDGAGAVVTAKQLKEVVDAIPDAPIQSIEATDDDIVGALSFQHQMVTVK